MKPPAVPDAGAARRVVVKMMKMKERNIICSCYSHDPKSSWEIFSEGFFKTPINMCHMCFIIFNSVLLIECSVNCVGFFLIFFFNFLFVTTAEASSCNYYCCCK